MLAAAKKEMDAVLQAAMVAMQADAKKGMEAHQAAMLAMHTETSKKMKGYMEGLLNRASGFICSTIVDSIKPQFQWLKQIFDEASSDM